MKRFLTITFFSFLFFPTFVSSATVLPVPFTPQAPFGDWRQPWQDACEEATIVMVDAYYANQTLDKYSARDRIQRVLRIKENAYGASLDESAATMQGVINNFFPWEATIKDNPTVAEIKNEIDQGRPVIALVYGRALYNPHFIDGGPEYHTLVLGGYDEATKEFVTKEPGTRFGLDFRYPYDRILNAIHDFVPGGKTKDGPKRVLFTSKTITDKNLDGDRDGLAKDGELAHGTVLWLVDSDGDGYSDGTEVAAGFLPTLAEWTLPSGTLIKSANDPKVYLFETMTKRHILNEQVFLGHGWRWIDIKIVSERFLETMVTGEEIRN